MPHPFALVEGSCGKLFDVAAFGPLVRRKRGELKITQETLAGDVFGDSTRKGDISRIENAKTTPQEATVQKLCDALQISDAEMEPIRQSRPAAEQLANIPTLSREELQNLAARFGIEHSFDLPDPELRRLLTQKAEEYRSYKALIDGLDERVAAIANLKGAAQHAAEQLNFDEVEMLLARVDEVETTMAAETKEARASNALLRNRPEQAFAIYESAADGFRELDLIQFVERRNTYFIKLNDHGLRYGGDSLKYAANMIIPAIDSLKNTEHRKEWASCLQNLASSLQDQGNRVVGTTGVDLLAEAVSAYRQALGIRVRGEYPLDWAMTTQNLATAMQDQGIRTSGPAGLELLSKAAVCYREALEVRKKSLDPIGWATTTQNLAITLRNLAWKTDGPDGDSLLREAIDSYRAALTVFTKDDHEIRWSGTMQNLAIAIQQYGIRTKNDAGLKMLLDALSTYEKALTVSTLEEHPVDWAVIRQNQAICQKAIAQHPAADRDEAHWVLALEHVDAAIRGFNLAQLPHYLAQATELRARILARE